jgi:hypothetical protein
METQYQETLAMREGDFGIFFANPYQKVWGRPGEPPFPHYKAKESNLLKGLFPFGQSYLFGQASKRTVDSHADLRFGPDGQGFRRMIHPNGVCLTGLWEITEETNYSGYFRKGSRGLVIARYSCGATEIRRGELRALALTGKLYPTTDPNHPAPLRPASFITMEDIAGQHTSYINDAELRSAPDTTVWRRPILAFVALVFTVIDRKGSMRQIYEIAELGKASENPRGRRSSCGSLLLQINPGSKVRISTSGTKSWGRFSTRATPCPSAS